MSATLEQERPVERDRLILEGAARAFGERRALAGVSLALRPGEIYALLGRNGAGKTTLIRAVCGRVRLDAGRVLVCGRDPRHEPAVKRRLGLVPQEIALYGDLTARENLEVLGRLAGLAAAEARREAARALEWIGLVDRAASRVETLSGGMKRRVNLAAGVLHAPDVLLLDEPTVGVDPQSRAHLLDCVRELSQEGIAAIYASHYMEEVQAICRRVAIVDHGRMLACGELDDLLNRLSAKLCLNISRPREGFAEKLKGLGELLPSSNGAATIVITRQTGDSTRLSHTLAKILELLEYSRIELKGIETHEPNLERLFLELTGNRLRD